MIRSFIRIKGALIVTKNENLSEDNLESDLLYAYLTPEFFTTLYDVGCVLRPLVEASLLLQRSKATLGDVLYSFFNIYQGFESLQLTSRIKMQNHLAYCWFNMDE